MLKKLMRFTSILGLTTYIIWTGTYLAKINNPWAWLFLGVGLMLSAIIITSEVYFKKRRHESPELFKEYWKE